MKPQYIIIHCSDSEWGCSREINKWHLERGFSGIGYNFVLLNGKPESGGRKITSLMGCIECGREVGAEGAHCLGYNKNSIGICLVGKGQESFCTEQFDSLKMLVSELCTMHGIPAENVLGHNETESGKAEGKTCPNFPVEAIRVYLKGRVKL